MQTPKGISAQILHDFERTCQEHYSKERRRTHLGASSLGDECARKSFYGFRWFKQEIFSGRMYRLFQRGHYEEQIVVDNLIRLGCRVERFAPDGKQFTFSTIKGHVGGSCDGKLWLPPVYGIDEPVLLEIKTSNDNNFKQLSKKGVKIHKPEHWAQMCLYGAAFGLNYALYTAVNKNDDTIHFELLELDKSLADSLLITAAHIVEGDSVPFKLSAIPTFYKCSGCVYHGVCHLGAEADKNCRSCEHAKAIDDAKWYCSKHSSEIPKDEIGKEHPCWEQLRV